MKCLERKKRRFKRLRQEEHELEAGMGCIVSCKPVRATKQDTALKINKTEINADVSILHGK